jgi:hypothetical protein
MRRYAFIDLDETVFPFRGHSPRQRGLAADSLFALRDRLNGLYREQGLETVVVSNMPAGQLPMVLHAVLGITAAPYHAVESGAVLYDRDRYNLLVDPRFESWQQGIRPRLVSELRRRGIGLEPGLEVNVIAVNPDIDLDHAAPQFSETVMRIVQELGLSGQVRISHGQLGNLADISPLGWGKRLAADRLQACLSQLGPIDWQGSICVGDSDSDLAFFEPFAELGARVACVGNASQRLMDFVLRHEGIVAEHHVDQGFQEILDAFQALLRNSQSAATAVGG